MMSLNGCSLHACNLIILFDILKQCTCETKTSIVSIATGVTYIWNCKALEAVACDLMEETF